jgi:predicted GNAT family acetyltransferase
MDEVKLNINAIGHGAFYIMDGAEQIGEMVVLISGNKLTVYHTEVSTKAEGKGVAKKLLDAMVEHARNNGLKVIPLCPYVHAQFKRHPEQYTDIWNRDVPKEDEDRKL